MKTRGPAEAPPGGRPADEVPLGSPTEASPEEQGLEHSQTCGEESSRPFSPFPCCFLASEVTRAHSLASSSLPYIFVCLSFCPRFPKSTLGTDRKKPLGVVVLRGDGATLPTGCGCVQVSGVGTRLLFCLNCYAFCQIA